MRIGLIVPGFSADENDWCIPALLNFVRALAEREEVVVFTLRYPHTRGVYKIGNAVVHSLGWADRRGRHSITLWAAAIQQIARQHRQRSFDVLHAFWASEPGIIAAWFSKRLPVIISLAGGELIHLPDIEYGLTRRLHSRLLIRWALRRASAVTAGSNYLSEIAQRHLAKRPVVAPLGVDLEMWRSASIPTESLTLLSVGSLERVKGHEVLLRAFQQVVKEFPSARLIIAGSGSLHDSLQVAARQLGVVDRVDFCGAVAHDRLPDLYRSAVLFVQSSHYEAQGMALLEAAACGLPIVGTRVGSLADIAPDAAIATAVGDVDQLTKAIATLLRNPNQRALMGRAARNEIERKYDLALAVERFVNLYQSLCVDH
ncbi:MAG TPA: glycosyltransferase family 4 protein [Blastocatellia bacterium]|nr:glycosyltransferase family 4 protein [Blastocatellia bacterium]